MKKIIISILFLISASALGFLGFSIYNLTLNPIINYNQPRLFSSSVKEFLRAKVSDKFKNTKPSEFKRNVIPNTDISFYLEPNSQLEEILKTFNITFEIVENGINDQDGTLQIKLKAVDQYDLTKKEETTITVSGFKASKDLNSFQIYTFTNELKKIQEITLKNPEAAITNQNFWEAINLPDNITKVSKPFGNVYTTKGLEDIVEYKFELLNTQEGVFVKLSYGYINNDSKKVSKIFGLTGTLNASRWKTSINTQIKNNLLPGNAKYLTNDQLKEYFYNGLNRDSIISVDEDTINNYDGYVYLKETDSLGTAISYAKFKLSSQQDLFDMALTKENNKIKKFIENEFNIQNYRAETISQYQMSDAFNFRYTRITRQIKLAMKSRDEYLKTLNIHDSFGFYDTINWKYNPDDLGVNFILIDESGKENFLYYLFKNIAKRNNPNFNKENLQPKSIDQIKTDLHRRTFAISYHEKREDEPQKVFITSGTAWIIDKSKTEPNTYFLATNSHVVERMQSHWDNIIAFSYTLHNDRDSVKQNEFASILQHNPDSNFRTFLKKTKWFDRNTDNERRKLEEDASFWEDFQIYNIGQHFPNSEHSADISIIKIKFPDDKIYGTMVTQKNKPEAAKYYDKMQANSDTKLKFFISKNEYKWDERKDAVISSNSLNQYFENTLPTEVVFGGYLSGQNWETNSGSAFLKYSLSNEARTINQWENYNDISLRKSKTTFGNPYQIAVPMVKAGTGMSGSLSLDRYGRVLGIFWGGLFPLEEDTKGKSKIGSGIGNLDPIGMSIKGNKTILQKWLDITTDIKTDLDDLEAEINFRNI